MSFAQTIISHIFKNANHARIIYITYIRSNMTLSIFMKTQVALIPLLRYGQNIQFDWNINAAQFKNFYPLTHQGSHAFHKNRRKGKRNLPLADRFVKPSKSASWFVRIFKGAAFLKSDHPLQVSTHEQIINDLLNASSGSSTQNEIRVFSFSLFLVGSICKRQQHINIYVSHIYLYKSSRVSVKHEFIIYLKLF